MATAVEQPSVLTFDELEAEAAQFALPPSDAGASSDSIARLRAIFPSLDEEVVAAVVTHNRGALVPSILQLIELADEDETATCIDDLEAALQEAALHDEGGVVDYDEQVALAAQSDIDEQVALALQQKMDADAAAAAAAAAANGGARAATPPGIAGWRRNVAKLAAKLSPSELGLLVERVKKGRTRTGVRLLEGDEAGSSATASDEYEADDRAYEPPVPPPPVPPPPSAAAAAAGAPTRSALYESRVARARTSNERPRSGGGAAAGHDSRSAQPNDEPFFDLAL